MAVNTSLRPFTPLTHQPITLQMPPIPTLTFQAFIKEIKTYRTALHLLATAPRSTHPHTISSLETKQATLESQLEDMAAELRSTGDALDEYKTRVLATLCAKGGVSSTEEVLLAVKRAQEEVGALVEKQEGARRDMQFYRRRLYVVKYGMGLKGPGPRSRAERGGAGGKMVRGEGMVTGEKTGLDTKMGGRIGGEGRTSAKQGMALETGRDLGTTPLLSASTPTFVPAAASSPFPAPTPFSASNSPLPSSSSSPAKTQSAPAPAPPPNTKSEPGKTPDTTPSTDLHPLAAPRKAAPRHKLGRPSRAERAVAQLSALDTETAVRREKREGNMYAREKKSFVSGDVEMVCGMRGCTNIARKAVRREMEMQMHTDISAEVDSHLKAALCVDDETVHTNTTTEIYSASEYSSDSDSDDE